MIYSENLHKYHLPDTGQPTLGSTPAASMTALFADDRTIASAETARLERGARGQFWTETGNTTEQTQVMDRDDERDTLCSSSLAASC